MYLQGGHPIVHPESCRFWVQTLSWVIPKTVQIVLFTSLLRVGLLLPTVSSGNDGSDAEVKFTFFGIDWENYHLRAIFSLL